MSSQAHGNTPAAWTGVVIAFLGFCVSGAGMVMASPLIFWVGMVLVVAAGVVGKAMSMAGLGKQPSAYHATAVAAADEPTSVSAA